MNATVNAPCESSAAEGWAGFSRKGQAENDRRMQVALLVFYLIDATLLGGYVLLGLAPLAVPLAFAAAGIGMGAVFIPAVTSSWYASLRKSGAVMIQSVIALALMLGTCVVAPPLTLLMLMTVAGVVSTAALRLPGRATAVLSAVAAAGTLAVMQSQGSPPIAPVGDWPQRLLTAVYVMWVLAKGASTNIVGAQWRVALAESHTQLAAALARVETLASRDELTGLPNRRSILQTLDAERERMRRSKVRFGIGLLDIDHFKRINDAHGHAVGDAVLEAFGRIVAGGLRDNDALGRYGGEEFLLILPGLIDDEGARRAGERLRESLQRHDWGSIAPGLHVTASFGMALAQDCEAAQALLERSDRSLYEAKAGGRNRVVVAAPP